VRVCGSNDVWTRGVDLRVDRERRCVDWTVAVHDLPVMAHAYEIACLDVAEIHAEWVHPEAVCVLGIAGRDVARNAFVKPEEGKESERRRKALLAVSAFFVR
jgi:hypothetical protein